MFCLIDSDLSWVPIQTTNKEPCKCFQFKKLFLFAPAAICVYCNGTNHSLSAPIVCACVCLPACSLCDGTRVHSCIVCSDFHPLQHWQLHPPLSFPPISVRLLRRKSECVCVCVSSKEVPLVFVCLTLVALVPPTMLQDKDCCLPGHKSSFSCILSLPFSASVSHPCPPAFLTLVMLGGEWSPGVRWGVIAVPLASVEAAHKMRRL